MSEDTNRFHATLDDMLARIPNADGDRVAVALRHGSLLAEVYAPRGVDTQQPHQRDEVYIVACGHGWFVNGDVRHPVGPGDFVFAPAGVSHRFEDFSDDLAVWVLFYGPIGGEAAADA